MIVAHVRHRIVSRRLRLEGRHACVLGHVVRRHWRVLLFAMGGGGEKGFVETGDSSKQITLKGLKLKKRGSDKVNVR